MKKIFTILLVAVFPLVSIAQTETPTPYKGGVTVTFPDYVMNGDSVTFTATVDYSQAKMSKKMLLEYTPVLRSTRADVDKEVRFTPVVIASKQRARIISRSEYFGDYKWNPKPENIIVVTKKGAKTIDIPVTVPFEKWLRRSELQLIETCSACCNKKQEYTEGVDTLLYTGTPYVFPDPYLPVYEVAYVTPEIEPVKTRSDSYTARLTFQSGRSALLSNFGNNASVLAEADRSISALLNDPLFTISAISTSGYASPEGNMGTNQQLSDARAKAFVDYLSRTHNLRGRVRIQSKGMGEDWAGLRKAVAEASYLNGQQAVLDAIDNISDIARRKTAIWAINGRRTWNEMLNNIFPDLRRNEYTIEYSVRSFNTEEAVKVYHTRPELLSLNELFMVASTMEEGSDEFVKVFDYAAKHFPDSPIAQYNRAAAGVKSGHYHHAAGLLEGIVDDPMSWNGLGIVYWHLGEHDKALEYFQKASGANDAIAPVNLTEYQKWFDDKDEE